MTILTFPNLALKIYYLDKISCAKCKNIRIIAIFDEKHYFSSFISGFLSENILC